jgi:hypothetical protein
MLVSHISCGIDHDKPKGFDEKHGRDVLQQAAMLNFYMGRNLSRTIGVYAENLHSLSTNADEALACYGKGKR